MVEFNIKPTEAITVYSLIVTGIVGSIGTMILAQAIKNKQTTPINPLVWSTIFTILATAGSVYLIAKQSKDYPPGTENAQEEPLSKSDYNKKIYNVNPIKY